MGETTGFLRYDRELPPRRPVPVRLRDFGEIYEPATTEHIRTQAARCMDCGIPFCNDGCPLGNLIPEWNDLVHDDHWRQASERLHATNNFPEFTGRLCPAPCEASCVLSINAKPVTIELIEKSIADRSWAEGWVTPVRPAQGTGRSVAVVGSGPAGLAAAQQLTRAGHRVVVFERDDRLGGLLRYGIPDFKMDKALIDQRLAQMVAEGTEMRTGVEVGVDITVDGLRAEFDAIVLATGSTVPRPLAIPGADLLGVHWAMDYLTEANRVVAGDIEEPAVSAQGKRVLIIGGGDTAADCLGTAHRQGATHVIQFDINPKPPEERDAHHNPWPLWPLVYRESPAHEEGGERSFAINTVRVVDDGSGGVSAVRAVQVERHLVDGQKVYEPVPGSEFDVECDLVLVALGFTGPARGGLVDGLGVDIDSRGVIVRDHEWQTSVGGVFVCGDAGRGQSLVVWAIAEGRAAAASVDRYLTGSTLLAAPVPPD